jgi:hypothetical protein
MHFIKDSVWLPALNFTAVKLDGYTVFLFSTTGIIFNHVKWIKNIFIIEQNG